MVAPASPVPAAPRPCPICAAALPEGAEQCPNCTVRYAEGQTIAGWLQYIRGITPQYSIYPVSNGLVAAGAFPYVFGACVQVLSTLQVSMVLSPKHSIRLVSRNPQTGEIMGEIGSAWSWPKSWTVRVFVQPGTERHRGVAVIVSQNYPTIGSLNADILNQVFQAISARLRMMAPPA